MLVLVGAAAAAYWGATWPGFYPKAVDVTGNRAVPSALISSKAGLVRTQNLWLQNTQAMEKRIESIPQIDTASVHRTLPADTTIVVTERTPFAVVQSGEQRVLVDRDLRVLRDAAGGEPLPTFVLKPSVAVVPGSFLNDPSVKLLRDGDDLLAQNHVIATSLELDKFGGLIATLRGGVRVLIGDDDDMEKKIALIEPILSQTAKGGRRVVRLDVRAPAAPVVVYAR